MSLMEPTFDQTTFSKNRERLLMHVVAPPVFDAIVRQADALGLLSDEHLAVDAILIEAAAASLKSVKPKDTPRPDQPPPDAPGNPTVNFAVRSAQTQNTKARPTRGRDWLKTPRL